MKVSGKPYFQRESRAVLANKRSALKKSTCPVSEELEQKWAEIYDSTIPLARILRQRREELQLTQADVARALDLKSSEFIGMVENGQRRLELNRVPQLAGVLKLDTETLCRLALFEDAPQFALSVFGAKIKTFVPVAARNRRGESVQMSPEQIAIYQRLYALPSALRLTVLALIEQFTTLIKEGPSRVRQLSK
jgi:transcriptional regulator with XRE-family HTH domain